MSNIKIRVPASMRTVSAADWTKATIYDAPIPTPPFAQKHPLGGVPGNPNEAPEELRPLVEQIRAFMEHTKISEHARSKLNGFLWDLHNPFMGIRKDKPPEPEPELEPEQSEEADNAAQTAAEGYQANWRNRQTPHTPSHRGRQRY
jgi:hypothetical protein